MTETDLRNEISQRAPQMRVLTIGKLFNSDDLDAVVQDRRGQYLWSVWRRQTDPPAIAPTPRHRPVELPRITSGQLDLF